MRLRCRGPQDSPWAGLRRDKAVRGIHESFWEAEYARKIADEMAAARQERKAHLGWLMGADEVECLGDDGFQTINERRRAI